MAKITLDSIVGAFASIASLNSKFQAIVDEFNDKVLYRDNPVGEPNAMNNDLDMGDNDIINAGTITAQDLNIANFDSDGFAELANTQEFTGDNNFTGALTHNGVDVATDTDLALKADMDFVTLSETGSTTVDFTTHQTFGAASSMSGNISYDLTNAETGTEIIIYHNDSTEPSFVATGTSATWVRKGIGNYIAGEVNEIIAKYIRPGRIEYVYAVEEAIPTSWVAAGTDADQIAYDNTVSGFAATNVQDAIDELDVDRAIDSADIDNLETLSGVASGSTDLGTFAGDIIADNETVKGALQDLEGAMESGTWTPTVSNTVNVDSTTVRSFRYLRIGNIVTVSGTISVDPTAASNTITQVVLSLPIASNFTASHDAAGVVTTDDFNNSTPGYMVAETTADTLRLRVPISEPAATNWIVSGQYWIL